MHPDPSRVTLLLKILCLLSLLSLCDCQGIENMVLRAVAIEQAPMMFYDSTKSGNNQWYGMYVDMMDNLLGLVNKNITYQLYRVPDNSFGSLVNGTWTGVVGELFYGRADIAFAPLTVTQARYSTIDYTPAYQEIGLRILVTMPETTSDYLSFMKPFTGDLWVLLLFTTVAMALYFAMMDRLSPYGYYASGGENIDRFNWSNSIHNTFMTSMGQGVDPARAWALRIPTFSFWFFVIIVLSSYQANLTAFLTVKRLQPELTSLDDIKNSGAIFAVVENSAPASAFDLPQYRSLKSQMVVYPDLTSATDALRNGEVDAFIHTSAILEYIANQQPCDTLQVGVLFQKGTWGIPLPKQSIFKQAFSEALLTLLERGVVEDLYQKWFNSYGACSASSSDVTDSSEMGIEDLAGLFIMLAIFVGVGLILVFLERLLAREHSKRGQHRNSVLKMMHKFMGGSTATVNGENGL